MMARLQGWFFNFIGTGLVCLAGAVQAASFPAQSYSLLPRQADGGVLFQCSAPGAHAVYLAGDFNGWAHNDGGKISDRQFAMQGPGTNGVWRKVVKLDPGLYKFKFNINGSPDGWFAPDTAYERDADGNVVLRVGPSGEVMIHSARNADWKPQRTERGMLFQLFAPDAFSVYLAGNFNQWAVNNDGLVSSPQYAMEGPDSNGVWRAEVSVPAGEAHYRFVVDGDHWVADPNVDETDKDGNSVLVVK
jgi:1,4-alpha-glucan branching enzyme